MTLTTRFAPSPTGPLHLGHAFSALLAHDMALQAGGTFLLRIDDLDTTRARPQWEAQIKHDLAWLGLCWPEPCRRESEHVPEYEAALDHLWALGLLYPCSCSRRDIREALSAPQETVHGPDGLVYPGTCRRSYLQDEAHLEGRLPRPKNVTLRLNMAEALPKLSRAAQRIARADGSDRFVTFRETGRGPDGDRGEIATSFSEILTGIGDVVLARREFGAAYHLAVVVDDHAQDVTHVVRGQDLFAATRIHVILQDLLGLPTPLYHHHRLIRDETGKRLAKRDDARAIATYRAEGRTPPEIRAMLGL